jgi:hypothetical protein
VIPRAAWALALLPLAACSTPAPKATVSRPQAAPVSSAAHAAAIAADAQKSEHEADSRVRTELAQSARLEADACIAQDPQAAACLYGRAVALGLEAKEHPTRAPGILGNMLEALSQAESADPGYDEAGPARVQALVLIRAPGWPLGPGDPERGLAAAQRAVGLRPDYPPNLLALAEAQAKMGTAEAARASYLRARDTILKLPDTADRADWLHDVEQGLSRNP